MTSQTTAKVSTSPEQAYIMLGSNVDVGSYAHGITGNQTTGQGSTSGAPIPGQTASSPHLTSPKTSAAR